MAEAKGWGRAGALEQRHLVRPLFRKGGGLGSPLTACRSGQGPRKAGSPHVLGIVPCYAVTSCPPSRVSVPGLVGGTEVKGRLGGDGKGAE